MNYVNVGFLCTTSTKAAAMHIESNLNQFERQNGLPVENVAQRIGNVLTVPETFESYLVNFEFWLNLTGNLSENRNRLKLNYKKICILSNFRGKRKIYIVVVRSAYFSREL